MSAPTEGVRYCAISKVTKVAPSIKTPSRKGKKNLEGKGGSEKEGRGEGGSHKYEGGDKPITQPSGGRLLE